ncbi:PEPxxWA-CTERM sorting domain-containing protein [Sphingomonas tabacisoli]|uniref:PEPxxWA-CTERM sorting domain-containing protein n=1 Tax=Sphingomonas tabacisoli TaxID=2249466 RepID=A0ABW4I0C9_9SPHN
MLRGLVAAVLAAVFACAPAGAAISGSGCTNGCSFNTSDFEYFSSTLPPDGQTHIYTYRLQSSDPGLTMGIGRPNQAEGVVFHKTVDGYTSDFIQTSDYTFKTFTAPLLTKIVFQAPKNYFDCANPALAVGSVCGTSFYYWHNDTFVSWSNRNVDVTLFFSEQLFAPVPEPATWAMMLIGFGVAAGAVRRRRAVGPKHSPAVIA